MKPEITKTDNLSSYVFGKIQPQAVELEEAVLGAILLDKDAIGVVVDVLKPESFYSDANQLIFQQCLRLFEKMHPIDMLTVTEALKKAGKLDDIGGGYYITELTNRVGSMANIEYHAKIVQQKYIERQLIKFSGELIRDAYEQKKDTFDLLEQAEKGIFAVTQSGYNKAEREIGGLVSQVIKQVEQAVKIGDGLTGEPSGITSIDRVTCGWQKSDLIILAARPGMGKTSLAVAVAKNLASEFKKAVAIFSLEMSATQLVQRMISDEARISGQKLKSGKMDALDFKNLQRAAETISDLPIFIDDTPGITITEMRAKCRRLKLRNDIKLVVVDYIQLMQGSENGRGGNREQEISQISRGLKMLAKELDVPVIALSQLSRAVETRGGSKRPQLSDLRESGAIEQDSDIVTFIYRPEYYQIMEDESGNSTRGIAEFIIAKHRNGSLSTVPLKFEAEFTSFCDLDKIVLEFPADKEPIDYSKPRTEFDEPFEPTKILTTPSKKNDDEDIPF